MCSKVDNKISMVLTIACIKCKTIKMDQDSFLHNLVIRKIYMHKRDNNSQITKQNIKIRFTRIVKCQDKASNQTY